MRLTIDCAPDVFTVKSMDWLAIMKMKNELKGMMYGKEVTVCKHRRTGLLSLRTTNDLFWTGPETNTWVMESDAVWESGKRGLVYGYRSLMRKKPANVMNEALGK